MPQPYEVIIAGLMRCCLASLDAAMMRSKTPPQEGDVVECTYCESNMIFHDGAWQWHRPEEV